MLRTNVLVLNNSFQPLHVTQARRALVLVMGGKAEVVEYYENFFVRTVSMAFQLPCVVRLRIYIQPRRRGVALNRRNILRRDNYRCQYCGTKREPLTTDHIIPRSQGGSDTWENLVTACVRCNNKKGSRTPERTGLRLLSQPRRPGFYSFIKFYHPDSHHLWRPYLFMD
ncbi:MAG: HNH endonuclease [Gemmatimonadota bacterium]|nr:HNH endonuclease [Gemmatimonadota bacterium]